MLYYPWCSEDEDVLGGFDSYEDNYNDVTAKIAVNKETFNEPDVENISFGDSDKKLNILGFSCSRNRTW